MNNTIPIFIISLKNSIRLPRLVGRLKKFNLKYKVFYGVTGKKLKKRIKLFYNRKAAIKNIDRDMTPNEIGASSSHLMVQNYIVKRNINQAIIMEDDAYPSKMLIEWIKNNIKVQNNEILSFYTYPSTSFLIKTPYRKVLKNKIGIHNSVTHVANNSCYQINKYTCKKIISLSNNKVVALADWPFLINKVDIKLSMTIPFIALIDDMSTSSIQSERVSLIIKYKFIKKILGKRIWNLLRVPYYLSYLGFFLKYKNKDYYYEHFFQKQLFKVMNFFTNKYLETDKIYTDKNFYYSDLKKIIKKFK